jgi:predicted deacylase
MVDEVSPVQVDLDFDQPGKTFGALRVPHSSNDSAYGQIIIPIVVIGNGNGPTLLFTGGVHGDESEGPIALMSFCREVDPNTLNGRVIVLPTLNLPAVHAATRICPLDGRDLNRVFPGDPRGSFTQVLAHYVVSSLFPLSDVVVDFHSGGHTLKYIPCVIIHKHRRDFTASLAAGRAFGSPMILISKDLETAGFLGNTSEAAGILTLTCELGGGMVSPGTVDLAKAGISNLLRHFGLTAGGPAMSERSGGPPARLVEIVDLDGYVVAPKQGLYEPFVDLGESLQKGAALGRVHHAGHTWDPPSTLFATRPGLVICRRPPAHVHPGDCVAIIGQVVE